MPVTVVLDNGAGKVKAGFAGEATPRCEATNGMARSRTVGASRTLIADQIDTCNDPSGLQYRRALERGCLVNWDTEVGPSSRCSCRMFLAFHCNSL
eukprot:6045948-Pleurochrysis_carterae.AAC.1